MNEQERYLWDQHIRHIKELMEDIGSSQFEGLAVAADTELTRLRANQITKEIHDKMTSLVEDNIRLRAEVENCNAIKENIIRIDRMNQELNTENARLQKVVEAARKLRRITPTAPNAISYENGVEIVTLAQDELCPAVDAYDAWKEG